MSEIFNRIKKLFTDPRGYWDEVIAEPGEIKSLLVPQMLILAAIPCVAMLVGQGLIGGLTSPFRAVFGRWIAIVVIQVVLQYALNIGVWIALAYIIDLLAQPFGAQRDFGQSVKLATGAIIPVWLGASLSITSVGALGHVGALGGLGFACYLLYLGLPTMLGVAEDKAIGYTAAAMGCLIGTMIVVGVLTCLPVSCCMATVAFGP